ncbi:hypothetical protein XELAEV_18035479mg [Xenopus laevis]|uniref:Uncharacterized protein n=1 Tax=Xenopus laevis TaxID=8355 RepID=A0A974HC48_XENLA|nr:hypothetical protein XELAEV_18035479mg [Xenopus laevis]
MNIKLFQYLSSLKTNKNTEDKNTVYIFSATNLGSIHSFSVSLELKELYFPFPLYRTYLVLLLVFQAAQKHSSPCPLFSEQDAL